MLGWALTFFVLALIAVVFGFTGVSVVATDIARILFLVFLIGLVIMGVTRAVRGRTP